MAYYPLADQLDKVFALVDSDQEGEALGALRTLRRLLEKEGLTFADLARTARKGGFSLARSFFSPTQVHLEAKIEQLQDDLQAHAEQNANLTAQIEFWRRRAFEMEQTSNLNQAEASRWKDMARQTAEQLWDLGKMARAEAFLSPDSLPDDEVVDSSVEDLKKAV